MRGKYFYEYQESRQDISHNTSFYGLLAVCIRKADSDNLRRIENEWPEFTAEIKERIGSPAGCLMVDELKGVGLDHYRDQVCIIDVTEDDRIITSYGDDDTLKIVVEHAQATPANVRQIMKHMKTKYPFVLPTRAAFMRMEEEDGWLVPETRR